MGQSVLGIKSDAVTKLMKRFGFYEMWENSVKYTIGKDWEDCIKRYTADLAAQKQIHGVRPDIKDKKYWVASFEVK